MKTSSAMAALPWPFPLEDIFAQLSLCILGRVSHLLYRRLIPNGTFSEWNIHRADMGAERLKKYVISPHMSEGKRLS